jgi:hypothetical protein
MFLTVRTLVGNAPQRHRNHTSYCVAASYQRNRELIGPTVADNLDFVHRALDLPALN